MKLVLLGTTGYHPNERRQTPCLLLPSCGAMLDAGTAVFRAARYVQTAELDVFLTHAHLDHVVGLTYFLDVLHALPRLKVRVRGEADKLAAIREHLFAEALFPLLPPLEFVPLEAPRPPGESPRPLPAAPVTLCDGARVTWFPLVHHGGSVGYRLDWPDRSMAYVTDTTASPDAAYLAAIRGVDLLVHECYFPDAHADWARKTGHSHTSAVADVARRAGVERLVLVHLDPAADSDDPIGLDVARAIFPRSDLGEDRMEIEF
jgi:ribonuclease Z